MRARTDDKSAPPEAEVDDQGGRAGHSMTAVASGAAANAATRLVRKRHRASPVVDISLASASGGTERIR